VKKKVLLTLFVLFLATTAGAFAASSFQGSCSNIEYAYQGSQPALEAACLTAAGSPNNTSLVLQGIGNQNGTLVQGSGSSSFQKSCGNIQITVSSDGKTVTLSALCRTSGGSSNPTSLPLNGISNNNGTLVQN